MPNTYKSDTYYLYATAVSNVISWHIKTCLFSLMITLNDFRYLLRQFLYEETTLCNFKIKELKTDVILTDL